MSEHEVNYSYVHPATIPDRALSKRVRLREIQQLRQDGTDVENVDTLQGDSDNETILSAGEPTLSQGGDTGEEEIESADSMSSFFAPSSSQEESGGFADLTALFRQAKGEERATMRGSESPEVGTALRKIKKLATDRVEDKKMKKRARSEQGSPQKEKGKKMVKGAEE